MEWGKGFLWSLRKKVKWEVRQHRKHNPTLKSERYPLRRCVLQTLLCERGLLYILVSYTSLVAVLLVFEMAIVTNKLNISFPLLLTANQEIFLQTITSYFLAAQVTVIGLLFPIAVALVTLIVQREDSSSTNSDVQVYYSESLAYRVGASGIALSIVLAMQLLWPIQFFAYQFGITNASAISKIFLTGFHLLWLIANLAALWHFLMTSLSFIRPIERASLRRLYAANVVVLRDISSRLFRALYVNAGESILNELTKENLNSKEVNIVFGSGFSDLGVVEVVSPRNCNKNLYDVWFRPLAWVIKRWLRRCEKENIGSTSGPVLVFVPDFSYPLREPGIICRRENGPQFNRLERFVIKHCFRFRKEKY